MSEGSRHLFPYKPATTQVGDAPTARPTLARQTTDQILSYYQSALADDGMNTQAGPAPQPKPTRARRTRQMSVASTSSSDYSEDSNPEDNASSNATKAVGVTRRSSVPSQGGSDRRRVAIVQMEALKESGHKSVSEDGHAGSTLRTRRGVNAHLEGLALVAPPDAAPKTYSQLTPPTSAPLTSYSRGPSPLGDGGQADKSHQRSTSEIAPAAPGSIRLVDPSSRAAQSKNTQDPFINNEGLQPSIVEDPNGMLSASARTAASVFSDYDRYLLSPTSPHPARSARPLITPEIGQGKEIHVPVAAPVIVNLSSSTTQQQEFTPVSKNENTKTEAVSQRVALTPFSPKETALYLNYQPGVHATAGPLPPPPRAMFDIDLHAPPPPRPPRIHSPPPVRMRGDLEAVKQALQLPPSVSAALAARSSKHAPVSVPTAGVDTSGRASGSETPKSSHHREGAFPVSSSDSASDHGSAKKEDNAPETKTSELESDKAKDDNDDLPVVTVVEPPPRTVSLPSDGSASSHEGKDEWVNVVQESSPLSEGLHRPLIERSPSTGKSQSTGGTPSPPPKSFRNSLTTNLKRFSSLPRTPSLSSKSRRSSAGTQHSSRTPSPSIHQSPPVSRKKIISYSPAAMYCQEVRGCKTSAERRVIYAAKINELYMYDCGLSDWLLDTKYRDANGSGHRVPSTFSPFSPQPRHTSRSSMISEATFPMRPDASTATDLATRSPIDSIPPTAPPPLPYPSLALSQRSYPPRSTSSIGTGTPTSSLRSLASSNPGSKAGGFFASLGRKTSISTSKRDKSGPSTPISAPAGRLSKPPPSSHNISRPINLNLSSTPSAPGGPRAPPGRPQRSLTLMTTKTSPFSDSTMDRRDTLVRRPSMFNVSSDTVIDIRADPEFVRQVDKLVDLLPHADRDVLAGYLRRAGQDILAIGQYLEDEKNGTIRSP